MGSNAEKVVVDYQHGERTAGDMKAFLEDQMPNHSHRVTFGGGDMAKAREKAERYGLPMALLFTSKPKTSALVKFLSTEFRRRLLLVEIPPTKGNMGLLEEYGLPGDATLPALVVVPPGGGGGGGDHDTTSLIRYEGDKFTRRKLQDFLSQHALKEPVYQVRAEPDAKEDADPTKKPVHTEL